MWNHIKNMDAVFKSFRQHTSKGIRPNQIFNMFKQVIDISTFNRETVNYKPNVVGIFINNKCNLDCEFCYFPWDEMKQEDMDLKEFNRILNHKFFADALRVSLAGGEPFLHRRIFDFIELVHQKKKILSIVSNGTYIKKYFNEIISSNLDSLMISHYEEFFPKIATQIKRLAEEIRYNKKNHYLSLCKIIDKENYKVMDGIIEESIDLKLMGVNLNPYFPNSKEEVSNKVLFDDNYEIVEYIKLLKNKYQNSPINITYPTFVSHDINKMKGCVFLKNMVSVDIDGNISPCCFIAPPNSLHGNLYSDGEDTFNNTFYKQFRKAFKDKSLNHAYIKNHCQNCYFAYNSPIKPV